MKTIALPSMLGLLVCLHTTPAQAIPETWVASNGGGGACTRAAPCADFQTAQGATDAGGVIKCVDAGEFGTVVITKSITIDCTGLNSGNVLSTAVSSSISVTTAGLVVTLRGLSIDSTGVGSFGVFFSNGSALHIENCRISGFQSGPASAGISITPQTGVTAKLHVSDTVIRNNGGGVGGGIRIGGQGAVRAVITRVQMENNNGHGIVANGTISSGPIIVQVRDSVMASNTGHGIFAFTGSPNNGFTAFVLDRSSSLLNGGDGIRAEGAATAVHIGNSTVIGNGGGLITASGGQILSYQNNQASGNGVDGAPTGVLTVK